MTQRSISIFSDIKNFSFKKSHIKKIYNILDESCYKISEGYLSVAFLDKFEMIGLHKRFLDDDTLTDVITFDGRPMPQGKQLENWVLKTLSFML